MYEYVYINNICIININVYACGRTKWYIMLCVSVRDHSSPTSCESSSYEHDCHVHIRIDGSTRGLWGVLLVRTISTPMNPRLLKFDNHMSQDCLRSTPTNSTPTSSSSTVVASLLLKLDAHMSIEFSCSTPMVNYIAQVEPPLVQDCSRSTHIGHVSSATTRSTHIGPRLPKFDNRSSKDWSSSTPTNSTPTNSSSATIAPQLLKFDTHMSMLGCVLHPWVYNSAPWVRRASGSHYVCDCTRGSSSAHANH